MFRRAGGIVPMKFKTSILRKHTIDQRNFDKSITFWVAENKKYFIEFSVLLVEGFLPNF